MWKSVFGWGLEGNVHHNLNRIRKENPAREARHAGAAFGLRIFERYLSSRASLSGKGEIGHFRRRTDAMGYIPYVRTMRACVFFLFPAFSPFRKSIRQASLISLSISWIDLEHRPKLDLGSRQLSVHVFFFFSSVYTLHYIILERERETTIRYDTIGWMECNTKQSNALEQNKPNHDL